MEFGSASHGASYGQMETLKNNIHTEVFDELSSKLEDRKDIEEAIKANWAGTAADNFITNVGVGARKLKETLKVLQEGLDTELDGIVSEVYDMDENLLELESEN